MKLDGISKTFFEDGQISAEETFKNGELEGISRTYHKNGNLCTEYHYKSGHRNGLCKEFDEKGNLVKEENYFEGEPIGEMIECNYRPNGFMKTKYIYKDPSKRKYTVSYYDWEGRLEIEKSINDGENDGLLKRYYNNGAIASKTKYKKGKMHGSCIEYNESGKTIWREKYINGVKKGRIDYFYNDNGKLKKKCDYQQHLDKWGEYYYGENEPDGMHYSEFILHDEYIYDDRGHLKYKKRCYEDGSETILIEYSYHSNGRIREEKDNKK